MEMKQNPIIRKLLQQDGTNFGRMQVHMATAREFLIIIRLKDEKESNVFAYLARIEKSLKDLYHEQNIKTEKHEDYDGEKWLVLRDV